MSIRVHELAKELGFASKDFLQKLKTMHIEVKGHMSALDEETAEIIRHELAPKKEKTVLKEDKAHKTVKESKEIKAAKEVKEHKETKVPKEKEVKEHKELKVHKEHRGYKEHKEIKEHKPKEPEKVIELRKLKLKMPLTVKELAVKLQVNATDVIKALLKANVIAHINQSLNEETIKKIGLVFGCELEKKLSEEEEMIAEHMEKVEANLVHRSPVVTFMGHVDHGKTSLLDAIRKSNVTSKESGGITQHIGAYEVTFKKGKITFLDTPGHEAFTAMRARGANVTDLVVLVVAADDGVMPQTVEALNHAKAANVPVIVAVNKIDLPGANPDKIKRQLSELGLTSEDWGGKTIIVPVSAKKGTGVDNLLEMILLEAEMLELKADAKKPARGVVIESKLSPGSGPMATVLVQNGTLRIGDTFVCGVTFGKVRAMINDWGQRMQEAGPSVPVEIFGLDQVPQVGDSFYVVGDDKKAKEISSQKTEDLREKKLMPLQRFSLDQLYDKVKQGEIKELKIIIKADVQGSLEALSSSLEKLSTKDIEVKIIHAQVGTINESDIMLAEASNAVIIGFHVNIDVKAKEEAERKNVDVRIYKIIYDAINEVRLSMEGLLEPKIKETFIGRAKVLQVFKISKIGNIAGCLVTKGKMIRVNHAKLYRGDTLLFEGKIESLKRFKDDAKEVGEGLECGIALVNFYDIRPEDVIDCYHIEKISQKL